MNTKTLVRKANFLFAIIVYYLRGKKATYAPWVEEALLTPEPTLEKPISQLVTASQFRSPVYKKWCDEMNEKLVLHRKQWEFVFVMEVLSQKNKLAPGNAGVGFGVGTEPLPAVFAKYGCNIMATDQDVADAQKQGWTDTNEHSSQIDMLKHNGIISFKDFSEHVTFEAADMLKIPERFDNQFDFTWSCCSLEHIGSIDNSIDFILNSVKCLKPGGVAVHTTEFNLSSDVRTIETGPTIYFRKKDVERLIERAEKMGYIVTSVNYNPGTEKLDQYIDLPPYKKVPHFKLLHMYVTTSIGIIIEKPAA